MDLFMKIKTLKVPASEKGAFVDVQSQNKGHFRG